MYYRTDIFSWLPEIEAHWTDIRDEMLAVSQSDGFLPWVERDYYNFGWKLYGLYGWGVRLDKHCDACPITDRLISKIPGITNAGFSRMDPRTHIKAHRNLAPEGVLRLHVPLVVPEGCEFRVEDTKRTWVEGECFVFDDCLEHEAWNLSDQQRVVMLVDFPATDLVYYPAVPKRFKGFFDRLTGAQTEFLYLPPGMSREEALIAPPAPMSGQDG